MKRYKFRLETIMRIRKLQEQQARELVAINNHNYKKAQNSLLEQEIRYQKIDNPLGLTTLGSFLDQRCRSQAAASTVKGFQENLSKSQIDLNEAIEVWGQTAKKLSALKRLDQRRQEEYLGESLRQETILLDEIGSNQTVKSNKKV